MAFIDEKVKTNLKTMIFFDRLKPSIIGESYKNSDLDILIDNSDLSIIAK